MVVADLPLAFATILSQKAAPLLASAENVRVVARRAVRATEERDTRNAGREEATDAMLAVDSIATSCGGDDAAHKGNTSALEILKAFNFIYVQKSCSFVKSAMKRYEDATAFFSQSSRTRLLSRLSPRKPPRTLRQNDIS